MIDAAALAALHARCFVVPRPWTAREFSAFLADPAVFLSGDGTGFALGRVAGGEAELLTLAVAPEIRGRGVGAGLVTGFLEGATRRGAETAFLEVAADNAAALVLYGRAGFVMAGRRSEYYRRADGTGVDALIMRHELATNP